MTLTVADFYKSHALSKEIAAAKMAGPIADALLLDVAPHLSADLLESARLLPAFTVAEWPVVLADVTPGDFARRRELVYKALTLPGLSDPATDVPTGTVADPAGVWAYQPLHTLWLSYLQPYWKQAAYSRFLLQHGHDWQKAGIVVPTDPDGTFQPIGSAHRAALQAAADNQADVLLSRLRTHLRDDHAATVYSSSCSSTRTRRPRKIRGV